MTKSEFVDKVATTSGLSKKDAGTAVDAVISSIEDALKSGQDVSFTGFGKFHVAQRGARDGRNPSTGEKIRIAASKVPRFSAGGTSFVSRSSTDCFSAAMARITPASEKISSVNSSGRARMTSTVCGALVRSAQYPSRSIQSTSSRSMPAIAWNVPVSREISRIVSMTSSVTPGTVENSCRTPSILILVTAAPGIEDSKARRTEFPIV